MCCRGTWAWPVTVGGSSDGEPEPEGAFLWLASYRSTFSMCFGPASWPLIRLTSTGSWYGHAWHCHRPFDVSRQTVARFNPLHWKICIDIQYHLGDFQGNCQFQAEIVRIQWISGLKRCLIIKLESQKSLRTRANQSLMFLPGQSTAHILPRDRQFQHLGVCLSVITSRIYMKGILYCAWHVTDQQSSVGVSSRAQYLWLYFQKPFLLNVSWILHISAAEKTIPKDSGFGNGPRTVMRYFLVSASPGVLEETTGAWIEDFICELRAAATSLLDSIQEFLW